MAFFFFLWLAASLLFLLQASKRGYFQISPFQVKLPPALLFFSFFFYFAFGLFSSLFVRYLKLKSEDANFASFLFFGLALVLLFFFYLKKEARKKIIGWNNNSFFSQLAKGIFAWVLLFPFIFLCSKLIDSFLTYFFHIKHFPDQLAVEYFKNALQNPLSLAYALFSTLILAPVLEEYLFRALLLNFLKNQFSFVKALIFSSVIFALFHFAPGQKAANVTILSCLFVLSLALGFLYEKYQSLIASIALHATFNAVSILNLLFFTK